MSPSEQDWARRDRGKETTKKKRKCRTAFSNAQIFGLEKRFIYQKYVSPVDRDEIALGLGLSNNQVSEGTHSIHRKECLFLRIISKCPKSPFHPIVLLKIVGRGKYCFNIYFFYFCLFFYIIIKKSTFFSAELPYNNPPS